MADEDLRQALDESERRYREVFETNTAVKLVIDPESGAIVDANPAACGFYGYDREQLLGMRIQQINTMPPERVQEEMERAKTERRLYFRFQHRLAGGELRDVECYTGPVTLGGRTLLHSIIVDQTQRRELERQLLRAQRLEIVGKLAGGVAHDFNNALTVMIGCAELGRRSVPDGHPAREHFEEIVTVAQRAAEVTRQLLALAKKQILQPKVVRLDDVVLRTDQMLRRLIGEDIELITVLAAERWPVFIDPGQVEQVLVNLVVNARDAMPEGGKLRIESAYRQLDASAAAARGLEPGRWVELCVSDTGAGMTPEVQARIFEPFFTTKEPNRGTGLGLATCQAIVEHAGGRIAVESAVGRGSRFEISLPAVDAAVSETSSAEVSSEAPTGTETILVVEDETSLRELVAGILKAHGYTVLVAANGEDALATEADHSSSIDLVVTDLVMPLMSGSDLAWRLRERRPEIAVMFMSGYAAGLLPADQLGDTTRFLAKPFTPAELARAVRDLLDHVRDQDQP